MIRKHGRNGKLNKRERKSIKIGTLTGATIQDIELFTVPHLKNNPEK